MSKKDEIIKDLEYQNEELLYKVEALEAIKRDLITELITQKTLKPAIKVRRLLCRYDRWWSFSVELWPGAWDLNYYRFDWRKHISTSREGQVQVGPFGFSWNRELKRA